MDLKYQATQAKQKVIPKVPTFEHVDARSEAKSISKNATDQVLGKGLFAKKKPEESKPSPIVEAMLQTSEPLKTTKGADELSQEMLNANRQREEDMRKWSEAQSQIMSPPKSSEKKFAGLPSSASNMPGIPGAGHGQPKNPEMMKKKG